MFPSIREAGEGSACISIVHAMSSGRLDNIAILMYAQCGLCVPCSGVCGGGMRVELSRMESMSFRVARS